VVDSFDVAVRESGAVMVAVADGLITADHCRDELGEVIIGSKPGRRHPEDITLYNSVGVGIQDIATARLVVDLVRRDGLGVEIDVTA
jgi:ornithine cyclodeaminase/alanine dehydrogenase